MRWNAGRVAVFAVSSSCGAAFDASVNVLCVLGGACGRITVDTASVRPCGGLTARKPTPVWYTRFEAVKTASSVPLVTVSGTVKRPHPDETQPILSDYNDGGEGAHANAPHPRLGDHFCSHSG